MSVANVDRSPADPPEPPGPPRVWIRLLALTLVLGAAVGASALGGPLALISFFPGAVAVLQAVRHIDERHRR